MAAGNAWNIEDAIQKMVTGVYLAVKPEAVRIMTLRIADMDLLPSTFTEGGRKEALLRLKERVKAFDPTVKADFELRDVRATMVKYSKFFKSRSIFQMVGEIRSNMYVPVMCAFLESEDLARLERNKLLLRFAFHKQVSGMSEEETMHHLDFLQDGVFDDLRDRINIYLNPWKERIDYILESPLSRVSLHMRQSGDEVDEDEIDEWRLTLRLRSAYAREHLTPLVAEYESLCDLLNNEEYLYALPQKLIKAYLDPETEDKFVSIIPIINAYEYVRGLVEGLAFISEMNEGGELPEGYNELKRHMSPTSGISICVKAAVEQYRDIIESVLYIFHATYTPLLIGAMTASPYDPNLITKIGEANEYLVDERAHIRAFLGK